MAWLLTATHVPQIRISRARHLLRLDADEVLGTDNLKRSALNNYFFGTTERLEAAINEAFAHMNQHPETALSLAYATSQNSRRTA